MKYCIGCIHLRYDPGSDGYHYSSWTHSPGSKPELACRKHHWMAELEESFSQQAFQQAMEKAETCADFSERPPESERGDA